MLNPFRWLRRLFRRRKGQVIPMTDERRWQFVRYERSATHD